MFALLAAAALCPAGFVELPSACLALPPHDAKQVLLYLHGMYNPDEPQQEFAQEEMVRERAIARGFAVLAPRGRAGLCDWDPKFAGWLCWPGKKDQKRLGGEMIAQWGPAVLETLRRSHVPGTFRPALLGYSSGGFYAAFVAGETKQPLRALAVLHGGEFLGGVLQPARALPTLLIGAEGDTYQGPKMRALQGAMEKAGWPSVLKMRPGGHALSGEDLDAALDFFAAH